MQCLDVGLIQRWGNKSAANCKNQNPDKPYQLRTRGYEKLAYYQYRNKENLARDKLDDKGRLLHCYTPSYGTYGGKEDRVH